MAKKLFKFILFTLLFIFSILFFLPKENIYYYLEKKLNTFDTVISDEKISEGIFSLSISDAKLYSNKIYLANIDTAKIYTNLFYTKVSINNIAIDKSFKPFIPLSFSDIVFTHSVFDPLYAYINAKSEVGDIIGIYKINEKTISFILKPNKNIKTNYKNMLRRFKSSDGNYKYEFRY